MSPTTSDLEDLLWGQQLSREGDESCEVKNPSCSKQAIFRVTLRQLCACETNTDEALMCIEHKELTQLLGATCIYCGAVIPFIKAEKL